MILQYQSSKKKKNGSFLASQSYTYQYQKRKSVEQPFNRRKVLLKRRKKKPQPKVITPAPEPAFDLVQPDEEQGMISVQPEPDEVSLRECLSLEQSMIEDKPSDVHNETSLLDTSIDSRSTCVPTSLFFKQPKRNSEIRELEQKKARLEAEIRRLSSNLSCLR
jgi:hypothetical protein